MPDDNDADDDRLRRVVVQGTSGSGKTTLARALASILGTSYLELDGLYQQPNWTPLDSDEFRSQVTSFAEQTRWVADGNYSHVRDILWPRATTIVILDLPKRVVMTRLIRRTFLRILKREQLWNGNRESLRNALSRDPNRNIIRWAWSTHRLYHEVVPEEARAACGSGRVLVLTSEREVRRFVAGCTPR